MGQNAMVSFLKRQIMGPARQVLITELFSFLEAQRGPHDFSDALSGAS
jgi:hypothetical protein